MACIHTEILSLGAENSSGTPQGLQRPTGQQCFPGTGRAWVDEHHLWQGIWQEKVIPEKRAGVINALWPLGGVYPDREIMKAIYLDFEKDSMLRAIFKSYRGI